MQWVLKLGSASPRRLVCRAKGDRFVSCSSTTMSTVAAPTRTTYQPIYTERQERRRPERPAARSAPATTPLEPLLVAFHVGPLAGGVAVCLLGAAPVDVEPAVVVLAEPHVLVRSVVGQSHG